MTDLTEALRRAATGDADLTYTSADLVEEGLLLAFADPRPHIDGVPITHISRNLFERLRAAATLHGQEPALGQIATVLHVLVTHAESEFGTYATERIPAIESAIWIEPNGPGLTALLPSDH